MTTERTSLLQLHDSYEGLRQANVNDFNFFLPDPGVEEAFTLKIYNATSLEELRDILREMASLNLFMRSATPGHKGDRMFNPEGFAVIIDKIISKEINWPFLPNIFTRTMQLRVKVISLILGKTVEDLLI